VRLKSDTILGRVEYESPPPMLWPWPTTIPAKQVCPVCKGKTVVKRGFYPGEGAVGPVWVKCRSCSGRGVV
jgi:hypothetical protein